ncbi:MAG TPA: hypothetical protein VFI31_06400 [Pirellulales bacterium]|nr:hypothetical protein [Pirellulales bacterium]
MSRLQTLAGLAAAALLTLSLVLPYVPAMIAWLAIDAFFAAYLFRSGLRGPTRWILATLIFWISCGLGVSFWCYICATPGEGERHVREWGGGGFVLGYIILAGEICVAPVLVVALGVRGLFALVRRVRPASQTPK